MSQVEHEWRIQVPALLRSRDRQGKRMHEVSGPDAGTGSAGLVGRNSYLTENRTCATIPSFEVRDVCRVEEDRWTWRPWKPLFQGKREGRTVVAIKVANKVPRGAKTTPFGNQNPTEIPCFISGLRVAVKTAKPLCAGSIAEPWLEDAGHRFVDRMVWHGPLDS